jgi:hypothetical protein
MQRTSLSPAHEPSGIRAPFSDAERDQVLAQLERMLESPLFSQSKRYAPFLRYIVEKTLDGQEAALKERIIGMEVLGRPSDYDSNNDPAVRVTAGEVRRRIAQYYQDPVHRGEPLINLFPGSYMPEFDLAHVGSQPPAELPLAPVEAAGTDGLLADVSQRAEAPGSLPPSAVSYLTTKRPRRWLLASVLGVTLAACCALAAYRHYSQPSAVSQWWQPALGRSSNVILCVGMIDDIPTSANSTQGRDSETTATVGEYVRHRNHVGLVDVIALERFASMLSMHNQSYRTLSAASTTFGDLRGGPVVLVAGLNNPWTLRVTNPLRFHFAPSMNQETNAILDGQNPASRWTVDFSVPSTQTTHDYALIARLHDITTDQPIFIAAGLGSNGTSAAAEYMTSEVQMKKLIARLPPNWSKMNIEAVIATDVIGNQPGPPTVVALHTW